MKIVLVLAASLGLAGCGSMDFFGDSSAPQAQSAPARDAQQDVAPMPQPVTVARASAPIVPEQTQTASEAQLGPAEAASDQTPAIQPAPATVAQTAVSPSARCTALAKQRAIDAAYQGEDGDTQESVYNRTYSDCVAWDLKHAYR